ncbi:MAG: hypothetical protein ACRD3I_14720, partial [Terriglobales bacterium]
MSEARIEAARLRHELLKEFRDETLRLEQHRTRAEAHLARQSTPRVTPTPEQLEAFAFAFEQDIAGELFQERQHLRSQRLLDADRDQAYARLREAETHGGQRELNSAAWDACLVEGADPAKSLAEKRAFLRKDLHEQLMRGNPHLVDWAIEAGVEENHWNIPVESAAHRDLASDLMRAWIRALEEADGRYLEGKSRHEPPSVIQLVGRAGRPAANEETPAAAGSAKPLSGFVETYLAEHHPGETRATNDQRRATIRTFIEVCGDKPPHRHGKQDVVRLKEVLRKLPANAARNYKGKTALEVLALLPEDAERQSTKTINDKLNKLSVFGSWLEANVQG